MEGKEGRQESCCWKLLGREGGARREACYFNNSSRDGREPDQRSAAQPKVLQLNSFPQTQTELRKGPTQSQRGKGQEERRGGVSRRVKQCVQLNQMQRNRKASQDRTNAPPQSSLQRIHRCFPKYFQKSFQNIPLLPRSVLPAALGVWLCLRTRCVRPGVSRLVRAIRRSCGRSLRRSTRWYTRRSRSRWS